METIKYEGLEIRPIMKEMLVGDEKPLTKKRFVLCEDIDDSAIFPFKTLNQDGATARWKFAEEIEEENDTEAAETKGNEYYQKAVKIILSTPKMKYDNDSNIKSSKSKWKPLTIDSRICPGDKVRRISDKSQIRKVKEVSKSKVLFEDENIFSTGIMIENDFEYKKRKKSKKNKEK